MSKKTRIPVPEAKEIVRGFTLEFRAYTLQRAALESAASAFKHDVPLYVKAVRAAHGQMTQADLAEVLEVDDTYISKVENGHATPTFEFLVLLGAFVDEKRRGA